VKSPASSVMQRNLQLVRQPILQLVVAVGFTAVFAAGCGSSGSHSTSNSSVRGNQSSTQTTESAVVEQQSAAAGDIPDNQVYLRFRDAPAGYSVLYPEGWTRRGAGNDITFANKSNLIHIRVGSGSMPTTATVSAEMTRLKRSDPALSFSPPTTVNLKSGSAIKSTYRTSSKPNSVTGKTILLDVDRYALGRGGKVATIDLARAKGVDTADAYRMIINSLRWQ
jgi:hypothetical protein